MLYFTFFGQTSCFRTAAFLEVNPQLRTKRNPPTDSINLHCRSCSSAGFLSPEDTNSLSSSCKNTSSKNKHFGPFMSPDFSISIFALFIVYIFGSVFKRILNPSKAEKDSFLNFQSPDPIE